MKRILIFLLFTSIHLYSQAVDIQKGVNLANWFQTTSANQIQLTYYTKDDLKDIKSLGLDHVRIPINMEYMTGGAPEYIVDPLLFNFLDIVIDWAEELELYAVLDNHTFDVSSSTPADYHNVLIPIWEQFAEHFKGRSKYVLYEILNEPHGTITDVQWNTIQMKTVEAIGKIDSVHTLIIGGAGWNSYNNLSAIPEYEDDNLIYTFHFYDPFLFTHQAASWPGGGIEKVKNIPFPYDASRMPVKPVFTQGEWAGASFDNYQNDGTVIKLKQLINIADNFSKSRNVKIYCGELGVYRPYAPDEDRNFWYETVINYLDDLGISWSIWDYRGDFGIYKKGLPPLFDYNLNVDLLEGIGLDIPEQLEYKPEADSSNIELFGDYVGEKIFSSGGGTIDFYSDNSVSSQYSIHWKNASRYNSIRFDFSPDKNLSFLVNNNFEIDFWIKSIGNVNSLDIRFIDTKADVNDHPWRMRYTLTQFDYQSDGEWHHVHIPLKYFEEHGSWDNETWYNPENKFDWRAVDLFEITSERSNFNGSEFWFDEIKIIDPNTVSTGNHFAVNNTYRLYQNFPNPFNPTTTIKYSVGNQLRNNQVNVSLKIIDLLGREVATLVKDNQYPGNYSVNFNGSDLSSGIYMYQLIAGTSIINKKMILLK